MYVTYIVDVAKICIQYFQKYYYPQYLCALRKCLDSCLMVNKTHIKIYKCTALVGLSIHQ